MQDKENPTTKTFQFLYKDIEVMSVCIDCPSLKKEMWKKKSNKMVTSHWPQASADHTASLPLV